MRKRTMILLLAGTMGTSAVAMPAFAQTTAPAPAPAAGGTQTAPAPQGAPTSQGTSVPQNAATAPSPAATAAKPDAGTKIANMAETRLHDRVAFFNARIAGLHAGLMLDPDQQKLWPPVEQAIRDLAKARYQEFRIAREGRRAIGDDAATATDGKPFDLLKQTGEQFELHGKALQALATSAQPLFASLTEEQRNRLPRLLQGLTPAWGPNARLLAMLNIGRGDNDGDRDNSYSGRGQDSSDRGADRDRGHMSDDEGGGWHHRRHHHDNRDWDHDQADHGGADMEHNGDRGGDDHAERQHQGQDDRGED